MYSRQLNILFFYIVALNFADRKKNTFDIITCILSLIKLALGMNMLVDFVCLPKKKTKSIYVLAFIRELCFKRSKNGRKKQKKKRIR